MHKITTHSLQRGFSIITAIFLLVVLSFLGIAMVSFSTSQHQSSAMDVMGSRAYQAARAGMDWMAYYVVNSASNAAAAVPQCTATNLGALGGSLSPFTVNVNCSAASHVEGAATIWIYDVSAVACTDTVCPNAAPGANYVERVISVKMGK
jgi:MSHA biogenesis protein MshP